MNSYYYIDPLSQQQVGPFPASQLYSKSIRPETMVWCAGMSDWVEAKTVDELQFLFNTQTQSQPQQQPNQYQQQGQYQQGQYQQANQYRQPNQFAGANNPFGNPFNGVDVRPMPKNWLVESILATILCCPPLGIAGIVNATKVESKYYSGDYEGAVEAGESAKKWCIYSLIGWFILIIAYFGLIFFGAIAGTL